VGVLLLIAPDQRQAKIPLQYIEAVFEGSPLLKSMVVRKTTDTIELSNNVSIEVRSASFRRLRGPTYIAVIADEAAFFRSEEFSANVDVEILNAVRPGLATTNGPLIVASSPYAKRGVVWDAYNRFASRSSSPHCSSAYTAPSSKNFALTYSDIEISRLL
jgi:hypothetical protein